MSQLIVDFSHFLRESILDSLNSYFLNVVNQLNLKLEFGYFLSLNIALSVILIPSLSFLRFISDDLFL